jgi:hypothetical protein
MVYGILDAYRNEIGRRYTDYKAAREAWKEHNEREICYLVRWMAEEWFVVLEPVG